MRKFINFFIGIFIITGISLGETFQDFYQKQYQEFFNYKNREEKEFRDYEKKLNEEFKLYKKIYMEEFEKYRKNILKVWDKAEIPTKKKFVLYSDDFKTKDVIDYDNLSIKISVVSSSQKEAVKKISKELKKVLLLRKDQAFKKNKLFSNLEKKINRLKFVKKSKVDKELLVGDLIFKGSPTFSELQKITRKLIKKSTCKVKKSKLKGKKVYTIVIKLPQKRLLKKAIKYASYVFMQSKKYSLKPNLIYAIIHTESSYNPLAQSPIPAYGLMQIVPQTAGKDATKVIYKKPVILSPSYLFNAKNNIIVGSVYLYLLYYRYFKKVKNPLTRLYLTISAYNGGIGRVAKALCGSYSLKKAIKKANSLSPQRVYQILITNLPLETKNYLKRVYTRYKFYEKYITILKKYNIGG